MTLRAALIQTRTPATHAAALAQVETLIRQAVGDGATLVVTPEGTNILHGIAQSFCLRWPAWRTIRWCSAFATLRRR